MDRLSAGTDVFGAAKSTWMTVMAKLPSFQFYPGDWMKDPDLRRCSHAAKGVLIDALCLMFESRERGYLATAGVAWSDAEVAHAIGGDQTIVAACLVELAVKGALVRDSRGALYSARMVRDEHKRRACSDAGKRGGNPTLIRNPTLNGHAKGGSKGGPKPNLTPSSSSSSSDFPPNPPQAGDGDFGGNGRTRKRRSSAERFANRVAEVLR